MCKKMIYLVCYVLLLGLVLPSLVSGGILYETSFDTADAVADWAPALNKDLRVSLNGSSSVPRTGW